MSLSSVIEKCISIVTGKGSESDHTEESTQQEQNFEQNQHERSWAPRAKQQKQQEDNPVVQNPEFYRDSDM